MWTYELLCFVQSCLCCWCQSFEEKQSLEEKQSCLKFKANDHGYDNFRSSNKYSSSWKKEYSFSLLWTEIIKTMRHPPNKTKQLCVCTKRCKNVRVIIFLTLRVTHDILWAVYSMRRKAMRIKKASLWKHLILYSQHFNVALPNFWYIHTPLTFKLSSLRIPIKDAYFLY